MSLFCFCERILRTRALSPARSPDRWWSKLGRWTPGPIDARVHPIGGGLGRLPTMPPIGFSCALEGSCCQQRGPAASTATTTDTTAPKTQTTSPTTPRFSAFFTEVVCTLGTTQPQTAISPPPNGGNGGIRTTTRRRHADSQPLMLQNHHRHRYGGCRRVRRAWPRCAWAAGPDNEPTRRSKLAVRMAEAGGTETTASQISHVIYRGYFSRCPKNVGIPGL